MRNAIRMAVFKLRKAGELLHADTFWTFDEAQCALAQAVGKFRHVPKLPTA